MRDINYVGEHLWVGQIGNLAIVLGFITALLATFSYFRRQQSIEENTTSNNWLRIGNIAWIIHSICIVGLFGILLYAMSQYMYEYQYVQAHVSDALPMKYILSAFWEGQEGSFMLWMIWHVILGAVIYFKGGEWKAPVLAIVALVNAVILTMILGVYVGFGEYVYKIGSNPTLLLRDVLDIPLFLNADYTSLIQGNGLNPLLQNYWMTIHPPVLFMGFGATLFPFAFAIAGLWTGKHKAWLEPALKWSLFAGASLGIGILMGSFWAYEALSFGGYWNWDPVENASLVPWMLLIAGIHTHLIAKHTGYAIKSTYVFYLMAFVFIIYSTFLTRSGVLGDTSAHAFTEMGLEWQLVFFVALFAIMGILMYFLNVKSIPSPKDEEKIQSREFWMYIGSLVMMFGGFLIISSTSLPVFNKIMAFFNEDYIGRVIQDPVPHYNKFQLWIGVFVTLIASLSIFLRYGNKQRAWSKTMMHLGVSAIIAAILTYLLSLWISYMGAWQYAVVTFFGLFAMVSQIDYLFTQAKGNMRMAASAISHFGFGAMLVGIITSGLNQTVISKNPFVFGDSMDDEAKKKVIVLIKGEPLYSEGYYITYVGDTLVGHTRTYDINFQKIDKDRKVIEEFNLYPNGIYQNDFSALNSFNPDTRHKWHEDLFTCVLNIPPHVKSREGQQAMEDTLVYNTYYLGIGDTVPTEQHKIVLQDISFSPEHNDYNAEENDFGVSLLTSIISNETGQDSLVESALGLRGPLVYKYPRNLDHFQMRIQPADTLMSMIFPTEEEIEYQTFSIKKNGTINIDGTTIELVNLNNNPSQPNYAPQEGDLAIEAQMRITRNGKSYPTTPLYVIRGNRPMSIKDFTPETGTHIRLSSIDPVNETFTFKVAQQNTDYNKIPVEIAESVPRSDYILLEAIIFPGINLFWLGTVMMMLGLFIAWILRVMYKRKA